MVSAPPSRYAMYSGTFGTDDEIQYQTSVFSFRRGCGFSRQGTSKLYSRILDVDAMATGEYMRI